jgi:hypothetical protein
MVVDGFKRPGGMSIIIILAVHQFIVRILMRNDDDDSTKCRHRKIRHKHQRPRPTLFVFCLKNGKQELSLALGFHVVASVPFVGWWEKSLPLHIVLRPDRTSRNGDK